ncbi:hypothetical protein E0L36_17425 [Streptomyces sp. AJS327]|uniref:hypothetical protein n=1 Tax=Streptomyces sp. AJS327 TaxID=2545265 RepID=UPI0015DE8655|nr:hypothetical protein [Streptomyces sp. AJS327]MBA0052602.1 hypothetical protein [Streptomyces sp. AJS327]
MSPSPTGPNEAHTFLAVCGHTHLFPGAHCLVRGLPDPREFAARPRPIAMDLCFSDGVLADADLRTGDPAGTVLAVPAYTTGAGTAISDRTWVVRELGVRGDEVELLIGAHPRAGTPDPGS